MRFRSRPSIAADPLTDGQRAFTGEHLAKIAPIEQASAHRTFEEMLGLVFGLATDARLLYLPRGITLCGM
jgi:hypothetical protein